MSQSSATDPQPEEDYEDRPEWLKQAIEPRSPNLTVALAESVLFIVDETYMKIMHPGGKLFREDPGN